MINPVSKEIRIFISSTFEDMQEERNYLLNKTFNTLKEKALTRGVSLVLIDLRWGITQEQSKSGKVVEICLDEIINSRPFFIGIVGNRYGWCPTKEELAKNPNLLERFDWIEKDLEKKLSITEIEMRFGVLQNKDDIHASFFIKKGEAIHETTDMPNQRKLDALKQAIRKNGRYPVYDYDTAEELGKQVEHSFSELLDMLYPVEKNIDGENKYLEQESFLRNLHEYYVVRDKDEHVINLYAESGIEPGLVIAGESGLGKSSLLANWIRNKSNETRYNLIYYFIGNNDKTNTPTDILDTLHYELCKIYSYKYIPFNDRAIGFKKLVELSSKRKPLVIIIDGINQLEDFKSKRLQWLPWNTENVRIILTTTPEDRTLISAQNFGARIHRLKILSMKDRKRVITRFLNQYGKNLMPSHINRIAANQLLHNTLHLTTLLNELIYFGNYKELDSYIDNYLTSENTEDFLSKVLTRCEKEYGENVVRLGLALIAASYKGLTENQIIKYIGGVSQLQWSYFFCAFRLHLVCKAGRITFAHKSMTDIVKKRYLSDDLSIRKNGLVIRSHITSLDKNRSEIYEMAWQLYQTRSYDVLYALISKIKYAILLIPESEEQFTKYWLKLTKIDYKKYSMACYLKDVDFVLKHLDNELTSRFLRTVGAIASNALKDAETAYLLLKKSLELYDEFSTRLLLLRECRLLGKDTDELEDTFSKSEHDNHIESFLKEMACIPFNDHYENDCEKIYKKYFNNQISDTAVYANSIKHQAIGKYLQKTSQYEKCIPHFTKSLSLYKSVNGSLDEHSVQSAQLLAEAMFLTGHLEDAEKTAREAIKVYYEIYGEDTLSPEHAECLNILSCALARKNNFEEALDNIQKAIAIDEAILGAEHPRTNCHYCNMGMIMARIDGMEKEASKCLFSAIEKLESLSSEQLIKSNSMPYLALAYNCIATFRLCNTEKEEYTFLSKACDIQTERFGIEHTETALAYYNYGVSLANHKKLREADATLRKALEIQLNSGDEDSLQAFNIVTVIAYNRFNMNYVKEAIPFITYAVQIVEKSYSSGNVEVQEQATDLLLKIYQYSELFQTMDLFDLGTRLHHIIEKKANTIQRETNMNSIQEQLDLGMDYYSKKKYDSTLSVMIPLYKSVKEYESKLREVLVTICFVIGDCYLKLQDYEQAIKFLTESLKHIDCENDPNDFASIIKDSINEANKALSSGE